MIASLAAGFLFKSMGYYIMLAWTSSTIAFFLVSYVTSNCSLAEYFPGKFAVFD